MNPVWPKNKMAPVYIRTYTHIACIADLWSVMYMYVHLKCN